MSIGPWIIFLLPISVMLVMFVVNVIGATGLFLADKAKDAIKGDK